MLPFMQLISITNNYKGFYTSCGDPFHYGFIDRIYIQSQNDSPLIDYYCCKDKSSQEIVNDIYKLHIVSQRLKETLEKECHPNEFHFSLAKPMYFDNKPIEKSYYKMQLHRETPSITIDNVLLITEGKSIQNITNKPYRLLFQNDKILVRDDLIKQLITNGFTGLNFL